MQHGCCYFINVKSLTEQCQAVNYTALSLMDQNDVCKFLLTQ